jgi:hypothetical protein
MRLLSRNLSLLLAPLLLLVAGCGNGLVGANSSNAALSVAPGASIIDTNCTGCNALNASGALVHQFSAKLPNGAPAEVVWSVQGGDATSGAGSISASGQYTPPSYLTADRAEVIVTATLAANPSLYSRTALTVTPGFLQPLTPENVALGANGSVSLTAVLAEAGGSASINFELSSGGQGSLSPATCQRDSKTFTSCTATYSAPSAVLSTATATVLATVAGPAPGAGSKVSAVLLINSAGVTSNPATHQGQFPATIALGTAAAARWARSSRTPASVNTCSATTMCWPKATTPVSATPSSSPA